MITRVLSLLLALILVATLLWNNKLISAYSDSLSLSADVSDVTEHIHTVPSDSVGVSESPTFMKRYKAAGKELQTQVRVSYFLSRGF